MTEAASSQSTEAQGQRLENVGQIPKPKPNVKSFYICLICRFNLDLANPFLIKPRENFNDQLNHFFNSHGPHQGGVINDYKSDY